MDALDFVDHSLVGLVTAIILGISLAALAYSIALVIYNLLLHPLRRFPGPKLFAASYLPYTYHAIKGDLSYPVTAELHEKYGDVVRIAPDRLSFVTSEAWKDVYAHKGPHGQNQKDLGLSAIMKKGAVRSITTTDDKNHARYRKLLSPAFSAKAIEQQESLVRKYIDLMITNLRDAAKDGRPQDMTAWLNWTTFDISGDLTFGEPFGSLERREYHPWVAIILDSFKLGRIVGHLSRTYLLVGRIMPWVMGMKMNVRERMAKFGRMTEEFVGRRLDKAVSERPDWMSLILKNRGQEDGLTRPEIDANASILIIAGSETTATLMVGALYLLCSNPDAYSKLKEQVRTDFKSDEDITSKNCNKQEYLIAVLQETFRLFPPTPSALDRWIAEPTGQRVAGEWVPYGTFCAIPHAAAYRSSRKFRDADCFVPERWLDDPKYESDDRGLVQPFSVGPRDCLGRNLAHVETKVMLAKLVWHFDFQLTDQARSWMDGKKSWILWEKQPLMLKVTPRAT